MEKKKNSYNHAQLTKSLKYFGLVVILIIIFAFILFLMAYVSPTYNCFGTFLPSNSHIEDQGSLLFPSTTQNIEYTISTAQGNTCTIWLQFVIAPRDIEPFQNSTLVTNFEDTQLTGDTFIYLLSQKNWSQPDVLLSGYGYSDLTEQWIFIDTSNGQSWIVYVITSQGKLR